MPEAVTKSAHKQYQDSTAVTDFQEFPDRGHSLTIDAGWRDIADASLTWLEKHRLLTQLRQPVMLGLTGLLSLALGVVLVVRPGVGAVSLAQVFGLFSFAYGNANLILALSVRESTASQEATT